MSTPSTIQTRIDEAEAARHDLAVGKLSSYSVGGQTFTRRSVAELTAYIAALRQDLRRARRRGRFAHVRAGRAE